MAYRVRLVLLACDAERRRRNAPILASALFCPRESPLLHNWTPECEEYLALVDEHALPCAVLDDVCFLNTRRRRQRLRIGRQLLGQDPDFVMPALLEIQRELRDRPR